MKSLILLSIGAFALAQDPKNVPKPDNPLNAKIDKPRADDETYVEFAFRMGWTTHNKPPPKEKNQEVFAEDEEFAFEWLKEEIKTFAEWTKLQGLTQKTDRMVHMKTHACLPSIFKIAEDIPQQLQKGIFAQPGKEYPSWIRFSNAGRAFAEDGTPDARGIAVKVMGLDDVASSLGEHFETSYGGAPSQDFLATSAPDSNPKFIDSVWNFIDLNRVQFSPNGGDIAKFALSKQARNGQVTKLLTDLAGSFLAPGSAVPKSMRMWNPHGFTIRNGEDAMVKFRMTPCKSTKENLPGIFEKMSVRQDFIKQLKERHLCWHLTFQEQGDDLLIHSPERLDTIWTTPEITVATILIPKQEIGEEFDAQEEKCAGQLFSPWNAFAAHQPVGQVMRARKWIYEGSAEARKNTNKQPNFEPPALQADTEVIRDEL